jgi:hypothetical protein
MGLGGWPEGKSAGNWRKLSAALNADHIRTALLFNAPDSEYLPGLQLLTSLEQLGNPAEMFVYPNELHIKNQPKHRYEIYERNLDWFTSGCATKRIPILPKRNRTSVGTRFEGNRRQAKGGRSQTDRYLVRNLQAVAQTPEPAGKNVSDFETTGMCP